MKFELAAIAIFLSLAAATAAPEAGVADLDVGNKLEARQCGTCCEGPCIGGCCYTAADCCSRLFRRVPGLDVTQEISPAWGKQYGVPGAGDTGGVLVSSNPKHWIMGAWEKWDGDTKIGELAITGLSMRERMRHWLFWYLWLSVLVWMKLDQWNFYWP